MCCLYVEKKRHIMTGRTFKQICKKERISIETDLNTLAIMLKTAVAHIN
jgi:DNA-binding CsgD family transcriptional regulator